MTRQAAKQSQVRILCVDDDPLVLRALARTLRADRGEWSITFVLGGLRAIEALRRNVWEIVVTDLEMSDADGREVIRAVRSTNPSAICVVHTAADIETTTLDGCQILRKPCPTAEFRRLLVVLAAQVARP